MLKLQLAIPLIVLLGSSSTLPDVAEHDAAVRSVMREIGIQYLISEDRKLPKADRKAWETQLGAVIDFPSLNESMRQRIRAALDSQSEIGLEESVTEALAEKAVLFLVPRQLSDYTVVYLRERENGGPILSCAEGFKPPPGKAIGLCLDSAAPEQTRVNFVDEDGKTHLSLGFSRGDRWRLSDIDGPISETLLSAIARWK